jgi:hypothetical protein
LLSRASKNSRAYPLPNQHPDERLGFSLLDKL